MLTAGVGFFIIALGLWILYSGWRLYQRVNWDEPKESDERRKGQRRHRHRRQDDIHH